MGLAYNQRQRMKMRRSLDVYAVQKQKGRHTRAAMRGLRVRASFRNSGAELRAQRLMDKATALRPAALPRLSSQNANTCFFYEKGNGI